MLSFKTMEVTHKEGKSFLMILRKKIICIFRLGKYITFHEISSERIFKLPKFFAGKFLLMHNLNLTLALFVHYLPTHDFWVLFAFKIRKTKP